MESILNLRFSILNKIIDRRSHRLVCRGTNGSGQNKIAAEDVGGGVMNDQVRVAARQTDQNLTP